MESSEWLIAVTRPLSSFVDASLLRLLRLSTYSGPLRALVHWRNSAARHSGAAAVVVRATQSCLPCGGHGHGSAVVWATFLTGGKRCKPPETKLGLRRVRHPPSPTWHSPLEQSRRCVHQLLPISCSVLGCSVHCYNQVSQPHYYYYVTTGHRHLPLAGNRNHALAGHGNAEPGCKRTGDSSEAEACSCLCRPLLIALCSSTPNVFLIK